MRSRKIEKLEYHHLALPAMAVQSPSDILKTADLSDPEFHGTWTCIFFFSFALAFAALALLPHRGNGHTHKKMIG
jgi:hypothetical protein